jgi:hypothetical protein
MKRYALFVFFLFFAASVFALGADIDDLEGFALGLAVETNGYSRTGSAGLGGAVNFDYRFGEWFGAGTTVTFSADTATLRGGQELRIMEDSFWFRWYFLRFPDFKNYFFDFSRICHPFLQSAIGLYIAWDDGTNYANPLFSASFGVRLFFPAIYIEPVFRFGVPVIAAFGVMAGWRFAQAFY